MNHNTNIDKKIVTVLLIVIFQFWTIKIYSIGEITDEIQSGSDLIILFAFDVSNSMSDDMEELRKNWHTATTVLSRCDSNVHVGIIKFSSKWEGMFAGYAPNLPRDLEIRMQNSSGSDLGKAVEGLLATKRRLSPANNNKVIGFIISDFWHDSKGLPIKEIFSGLAEIDSVYLSVIGHAPYRIVDQFPANCRAVSEKELATILEDFVNPQPKPPNYHTVPKNTYIRIILVLIFVALVFIIRKKHNRPIKTEKIGNHNAASKFLLRIEAHFDHQHRVNIFDLNKGCISVGANGDVQLKDFIKTSITLCRSKKNHLEIINTGETIFYVNQTQVNPSKRLKYQRSGAIEIPFEKEGRKSKAIIRFMGVIK